MNIEPGKSVGEFWIGMKPEECESVIGPSSDVFKRTPEAIDSVIAYDSRSLHLTVDDERRIKSITVFRPQKVEFEGIQLLGRDFSEVEADLARSSYPFSRVDAGLWSSKAGVLIIENDDGIVDGVEVTSAE